MKAAADSAEALAIMSAELAPKTLTMVRNPNPNTYPPRSGTTVLRPRARSPLIATLRAPLP